MRNRTVPKHTLGLALVLISLVGLAVLGPEATAVACAHLITPKKVGEGPYEQFEMAKKLKKGEFQRYESQEYILCHYTGAEKDQGPVLPTIDIRYLFDAVTRELVMADIEWRRIVGGPMSGSCLPAPQCNDYLTTGRIGQGVFDHYGIAEKLEGGEFHEMCSRGVFSCFAGREIGGIEVLSDGLLFDIDMRSGELMLWRINWREDLSEPIPPLQISRDEAEAMFAGMVQPGTHLVLISPEDFLPFNPWLGLHWDSGYTQPGKSVYYHPCWFIFSSEGPKPTRTCTTVVDAVTGEIVRRHCGP